MECETSVDMTSEKTKNCRVHVGNLSVGYVPALVRNLFTKCGKIVGVSPKKNYMFVQFANEQSAEAAIKESGKIYYQGRRITVKPAKISSGSDTKNPPKNAVENSVYLYGKTIDICTNPKVLADQLTAPVSVSVPVPAPAPVPDTGDKIPTMCEVIVDSDCDDIFYIYAKRILDPLMLKIPRLFFETIVFESSKERFKTHMIIKPCSITMDEIYKDIFSSGCIYAMSFEKTENNLTGVVKLKVANIVDEFKVQWNHVTEFIVSRFPEDFKQFVKKLFEKVSKDDKLHLKQYDILIQYIQSIKMDCETTVDMTSEVTRNCRVHVGNLPIGFEPTMVRNLFTNCGKIVGVNPKKNYMFVQFDNEHSAKAAIIESEKISYQGRLVTVKPAKISKGTESSDKKTTMCEVIIDSKYEEELAKKILEPLMEKIPLLFFETSAFEESEERYKTHTIIRASSISMDEIYRDMFSNECIYAISFEMTENKFTGIVKLRVANSVKEYKVSWNLLTDFIVSRFPDDFSKKLSEKVSKGEKLQLKQYDILIQYLQECRKKYYMVDIALLQQVELQQQAKQQQIQYLQSQPEQQQQQIQYLPSQPEQQKQWQQQLQQQQLQQQQPKPQQPQIQYLPPQPEQQKQWQPQQQIQYLPSQPEQQKQWQQQTQYLPSQPEQQQYDGRAQQVEYGESSSYFSQCYSDTQDVTLINQISGSARTNDQNI